MTFSTDCLGDCLHPGSRPLLAPTASLSRSHDGLALETREAQYAIAAPGDALLESMVPSLRGECTVAELASSRGADPAALCALLEPFARDHVILDVAAIPAATTGHELIARWRRECAFWASLVVDRPFWHSVLAGDADRRTILGWGVEFSHFVEAANEYMPVGIAYCRDGAAARELLSRHYVDEADHARFFVDGLVACGLSASAVRAAPALPSTRALINFLVERAIEGGIAYPACFGLMQAGNATASPASVNTFYDHLSTTYPYAAGLFDAYRRHTLLDVELEHRVTIFEQVVSPDRSVERREAVSVALAVRAAASHFALFFDGIAEYYRLSNHRVPRRPFRSAAFS